MMRVRALAALLGAVILGCAAALFAASPASAASLQQITNFGNNPSRTSDVSCTCPTASSRNPAIVVGVHWCSGNGAGLLRRHQYASSADQYGFIVIYPSAPQQRRVLGRPLGRRR